MAESIAPKGSGTSPTKSGEPHESTPTLSDIFPRSFRLFSQAFAFTHWYIFPLSIYVLFLILELSFDFRLNALSHKGSPPSIQDLPDFKNVLTSLIFLVSGVLLTLSLLSFNGWIRGIPAIFQWLTNSGHVCSTVQSSTVGWHTRGNASCAWCSSTRQSNATNEDYQSFLIKYQKSLLSKKRAIPIIISILIFTVIFFFAVKPFILPDQPIDPILSIIRWIVAIIRVVLIATLLGAFYGVAIWTMGTAVWYTNILLSKFTFNVLPGHPDGCGGLKPLGNFYFAMALPILAIALFFGVYIVGDSLFVSPLQSLLTPSEWNSMIVHNPVIFILLLLIIFALLLIVIACFVPVWHIHRSMLNSRSAYEDDYAQQSLKLQQQIRAAVDKGAPEEGTKAVQNLELLQMLLPDKIGYRVWPFTLPLIFTFLGSNILAFAGLLVSLLGVLLHGT